MQLRFGEDAVGEALSGGGVPPVGAVPGPGRVPAGAVRDVEHLQADDGPALGARVGSTAVGTCQEIDGARAAARRRRR